MASDAYLQIEGIKGESMDSKHQAWIEVTDVQFGVTQPRSATASTGGGHTAERAELSEIVFTKVADISSPILLQTCAMGKTIPKAKFEFMRADGNGEPIKYFMVELENVLIGQVRPDQGTDNLLYETVALKYSKIRWTYTQQKIGGGSSGSTMGGWDCASNRVIA